MSRVPTRNSSLMLMLKRAEFIKAQLMSSKMKEYGEDHLLVKDLKALLWLIEDYDDSVNGGQLQVLSLPKRAFVKLSYEKESILYRVEEIMALLSAEMSLPEPPAEIELSDDSSNEDSIS